MAYFKSILRIYRLYLKASECAPTNHSDKRIWGEVILKPAIFRGYRTHSALVGLLIGCQSVPCQALASQATARNSEAADDRSEERRVGKERVRKCRSRW